MERILLVEDDPELGAQVVHQLERAGFAASWIRDGDEARGIDVTPFSLVVLDLMLPGTYGMDLLKLYRRTSEVPVLILSARDDTADKVRGLKLGADDYLTKPFFPEELVARIQACLRRPVFASRERVQVGILGIDLDARRVQVAEHELELAPAEFNILTALARRKGSAVTRQRLMEAAVAEGLEAGERSLDVHISRLRKKLGRASAYVQTVWGIGYRLDADEGEP